MRKSNWVTVLVMFHWFLSIFAARAQQPTTGTATLDDPAAEKIEAMANAEEDFVEGPEPDAIFQIPVEPMTERNASNAMTTGTLAPWRGQVLLIVNVASRCGFTRQYEQLEAIYRQYKDRGFVVLGFPSNDFMGQEPGTEAEILSFCSSKYDVTFPLYAKLHAKGDEIAPLYRYLTSPAHGFPGQIGWNFTKFVISRDGRIAGRFESKVKPDAPDVIKLIETELARPQPSSAGSDAEPGK